MSNPKNILVTGSSGFVGKRLTDRLAAEGHTVTGLDRATGVDLSNWDAVANTPKADLIYHLAAITFVPDSFERPRHFHTVNFTATLHMLELAREWQVPFVFASSYVYGPPEYLPIDEKHPVKAVNPYMASKALCEDLCRSYARSFDLPVTIIRPFNIYGPGQPDSFLIPTIINGIKAGNVSLKDPEPKRDLVYVDDVVDAYVKAGSYRPEQGDVFNIGQGQSYSIGEMVETAMRVSGLQAEVHFSGEKRKNEVMDTVADCTKAEQLLGWKPQFTLEQGLSTCFS